jgi:hypothetical protein
MSVIISNGIRPFANIFSIAMLIESSAITASRTSIRRPSQSGVRF